MKKFLSMVMALAMTLTLVTVGASAKDFTDKSSISYKEAVDVISTLGVVDGYSDGTFNPSATLTRGAAAKIICNLLLGPTAASALGVTSAPYKDVPVSNVFSGYIAYCSSQSIINGYSDGTFKPAGTVTGFQFLKMLLGALGYDGSIEGFTGTNWAVNVAKLAITTGLTDGNDTFVGSKAMTRQEAALYALNLLKTPMVQYANKGTKITQADGTVISIGATAASPIDSSKDTINHDNGYLEFAEQYFSKLVLQDGGKDKLGRPSDVWTYKGAKVGTYAQESADVTFTASTKESVVKSTMDSYDYDTASIPVIYNGTTVNTVMSNSVLSALTGNGTLVEVYVTNNKVSKVVVAQAYLGKVTSVSNSNETITVAITYGGSTKNITTETGYGTYVKDDYVMVTPAYVSNTATASGNDFDSILDGSGEDAYYISAATKVTGTVSQTVTTSGSESATIAGTTYKKAAQYVQSSFSPAVNDTTTVDAYLDAYGYLVNCDSSSAAGNYLYLAGAYAASGDYGGYATKAQIITTDGTISTVTVSTVGGSGSADTTLGANTTFASSITSGLYSYTTSSGKYALTSVTSGYGHHVSGVALSSSDVKVGSYYFSDSSNVIMVTGDPLTSDLKASVYTGKTATAGTPDDFYVVTTKSVSGTGTIDTVFVIGSSAVTSDTNVIYAVSGTKNGSVYISGTKYDTYSVYLNGEKTTIPVTDSTTVSAHTFYDYGTDANGVYTLSERTSGVVTAPAIATVYNNYVTVAGDLSGGNYSAADATVVDTRSNPDTTIDSLSLLKDYADTVSVQAVYNSSDKTISTIYVLPNIATTVTSDATAPVTSISSGTINVGYNGGTAYKMSAVLADLTFADGSTYVVKTAAAGTVIASANYATTDVVDDQVIVVTAQDGTTTATYTIAVANS